MGQKANPSPRIPSPSLEWNTSQDQWSVDEIESHEEQERTDCFKESSQARLETILALLDSKLARKAASSTKKLCDFTRLKFPNRFFQEDFQNGCAKDQQNQRGF